MGKYVKDFEGVHEENGFGKRNVTAKLPEFCGEKRDMRGKQVVSKTREKSKITYSTGGYETEIAFSLVGKKNSMCEM